jgi:predicted  nucleic acid-binding Zn-ribbon protein
MVSQTDTLLTLYEETEAEVKALEALELDSDEAKEKLESIMYQIEKKVTQMDVWVGSLKNRNAKLEDLKNQFKDAIKGIDTRIKRNEDTQHRILYEVLPKLVNSRGKLETGYKTYTIYESDGELEIIDQAAIPAQFVKTKIEQTIDKMALKKFVKENPYVDYAKVSKVKRVRIT